MGWATSPFALFPWASAGPSVSLVGADPATPPLARGVTTRVITLEGDYELSSDGTGEYKDGDPVDQEVLWRLRTIVKSFAGSPTIGNDVTSVLFNTDDAIVATRDAVLRALQPMIDRGVIDQVEITPKAVVQGGTAINSYAVEYRKTGLLEG